MDFATVYTLISAVLMCAGAASIYLVLMSGIKLMLFALISYVAAFIAYYWFKEKVPNINKAIGFSLLKFQTVLFVYCIGAIPAGIALKLGSLEENMPLFMILFALFSLFAIASLKADKAKDLWESIENGKGLSKKAEKEESTEGDVILCKDKETKKDVILPLKERFRHMLLLGPTGSGKTSMILLPMLEQDIQNHNAGITVIDPKGDLAEKVYQMALYEGREAIYFNPIMAECPSFNPLYGNEAKVVESICTTFNLLNPNSNTYYKNMNDQLLRNAIPCVKRVIGKTATLLDLNTLIQNTGGQGRSIVQKLRTIPNQSESMRLENEEIASYFLDDYWMTRSVSFQNTSDVRAMLRKLVSNPYTRKVLNPENGISDVNFEECLASNKVLAISTAKGSLGDLNKFLGYFLILQFQNAVFARPGDEDTRSSHFLYIDEFQNYANEGFNEVLTQARSYRVAAILATQNRAQMALNLGQNGESFLEGVNSNTNTLILYPNRNDKDAKYYSDVFGTITRKRVTKGKSKSVFSIFAGPSKMRTPTESVSEVDEDVARFTVEDLIYGLGDKEIVYAIPKGSTYLPPAVGCVDYLEKSYNDVIKSMVNEYKERNALKIDPETGEERNVIEAGGILFVDNLNVPEKSYSNPADNAEEVSTNNPKPTDQGDKQENVGEASAAPKPVREPVVTEMDDLM